MRNWLTILAKKGQFSVLILVGGMAGLNNGYCPICPVLYKLVYYPLNIFNSRWSSLWYLLFSDVNLVNPVLLHQKAKKSILFLVAENSRIPYPLSRKKSSLSLNFSSYAFSFEKCSLIRKQEAALLDRTRKW